MKTVLKRKFLLLFTIFITLLACEDDESVSSWSINGIWKSEGYGMMLDIKDGKVELYSLTDISCVKERELDLNDFKYKFVGKDRIKLTVDGAVTEFSFTKLTELPAVAKNGGTPPTTDPYTNFDIFTKTFDEHYAFFQERGVPWETLKAESRAKVNEANLFEVLGEIVLKTKDSHVNLIDMENNREISGSQGFYEDYSVGESEGSFEELMTVTINTIENKYLKGQAKRAANDIITWGDLGDGVAYLRIDAMTGYSEEDAYSAQHKTLEKALDQVIDELKSFDKLVMDIRFNQGGADMLSLEIAGRFADQKRLAWTKKAKWGTGFTPEQNVYLTPKGKSQFNKPIILITSIGTASAAETFTLAMNTLPYVQIIGDRTHGIFSDALYKQLPNGWIFTLSNEVHLDPQGAKLEGKGVTPDVMIPMFSNSDLDNGIDTPIETAIQIFKK